MYAHNEMVADVVREQVAKMFAAELAALRDDDLDWEDAPESLKAIQTAITCYGFGYGYDVERVSRIVEQELEDAPLYRLNEIAEELELDLKVGFVGFN